MKKIYNNILEIKDLFDVFIFDAFGVFWDGSKLYHGSDKVMEDLVKSGKTVCILSNSPRHKKGSEVYSKKYIFENTHFNYFLTSGMVLRHYLESKKLVFNSNKNPKNVYLFGVGGDRIFEGTDYNIVDSLDKADFVYISTPKINEDKYRLCSKKDRMFESGDEDSMTWNTETIDPFIEELEDIINTGLPALNANPDITARTGVRGADECIFAIRGGTIVKYLKERGTEVVEFGKPHRVTYDFALNFLKDNGVDVGDKNRVCMVGDTLRTDIKGANNIGIKSVLCYETGITANELKNGKTLDELIKQEEVLVDYAIRGVATNI